MKEVMYKDCNNNAGFLRGLFIQIRALSDAELNWSISGLEFIPVDHGDFIGGVPDGEMKKIYDFQKRILDEYTITVTHSVFMELLRNIRTVYEGRFETLIGEKQFKVKVFDGDIIEIDGEREKEINIWIQSLDHYWE